MSGKYSKFFVPPCGVNSVGGLFLNIYQSLFQSELKKFVVQS